MRELRFGRTVGFTVPHQTMCFDTNATSTRGDWDLTLCLEAAETILPTLARGSATGVLSASWGNSPQPTFSFTFRAFLLFCRYFPQLALRFCDSAVLSHITTNSSGPLISIVPGFFDSLAGTFLSALPELVRIVLTYPTLDVFPHAHSHLAAGIGFPL
jgi:hypothetical protein